jgi:hypothetical protein
MGYVSYLYEVYEQTYCSFIKIIIVAAIILVANSFAISVVAKLRIYMITFYVLLVPYFSNYFVVLTLTLA